MSMLEKIKRLIEVGRMARELGGNLLTRDAFAGILLGAGWRFARECGMSKGDILRMIEAMAEYEAMSEQAAAGEEVAPC